MANEQRFYRKVSSVEEAQTAIHELTDHVYDLRGQVDDHKRTIEQMKSSQYESVKEFNTKINGLFIKGIPPANGQKLTWNAATGQIEWA